IRRALSQLLRHAALALAVQQRPAESMSEQRLLQGDAGPFAPCLQAQIAAQFGHGDIALEACIVERAPGGDGASAGQSQAMNAAQESRMLGQTIRFWLTIPTVIAAARTTAPA